MLEIQKDLTGFYPRLRRWAIQRLTDWEPGLRGLVSNTQLRKWGYYHYKKCKMEGW